MHISDWSSDVCSSDRPQTVSFGSMAERQQKAVNLILKDPDVAAVTSFIGIDGTNATLNTGRMQIVLKPAGERDDKDRKSVVEGKSVPVRVDVGGRLIIKKKTNKKQTHQTKRQS